MAADYNIHSVVVGFPIHMKYTDSDNMIAVPDKISDIELYDLFPADSILVPYSQVLPYYYMHHNNNGLVRYQKFYTNVTGMVDEPKNANKYSSYLTYFLINFYRLLLFSSQHCPT